MKNVTIITGGAGGMGIATARILGKDNLLILTDVSADRLESAVQSLAKEKIESHYFVGDVTKQESVKELFEFAASKGRISSVVHTAGISPQMGSADFIIRVNALGTIHIAQEFFRQAEEGGSLVNVASMAGHLIPSFIIPTKAYEYALTDESKFFKKMIKRTTLVPKSARSGMAYSISKRFVIWYSNKLARQFGTRNLRILSVSPGTFNTEMGKLEEKSGASKIAENSALGRVGRVEEIAGILACAAGRESSYMTGIDILCDGGTVASISLKEMSRLAP